MPSASSLGWQFATCRRTHRCRGNKALDRRASWITSAQAGRPARLPPTPECTRPEREVHAEKLCRNLRSSKLDSSRHGAGGKGTPTKPCEYECVRISIHDGVELAHAGHGTASSVQALTRAGTTMRVPGRSNIGNGAQPGRLSKSCAQLALVEKATTPPKGGQCTRDLITWCRPPPRNATTAGNCQQTPRHSLRRRGPSCIVATGEP